MAEDNTDSSPSSVTSGKNESDGGRPIESSTDKARRLSTGRGVLPSDSLSPRGSDDGISSRRYSTGKQISAKSDQSNLPHYLRASTGSCHDFCKYGRKHSFEQKPMLPLSQRVKKPHHRKLNSAGAIVVEGTKAKQSPDQPTLPLSQRIKQPHHRKLNSEGAIVGEGKKANVAEQTPSDPSRDPEIHFLAPPEIIKEVVFLQPKEVEPSPIQDSSSDKMMPKTDTKMKNLSAKWSSRPQAKVSKQSSINKSLEGVKPAGRRLSDIGSVGNSGILSLSTSKSSVSKSPNMRKRMSNSSTLAKTQNRMGEVDTKTEEEKVSEKTLHVIEMEPKDDLVEPAQDGEIMEGKDDDLMEPAQDDEIIASFSPPSSLLPESSSNSNSRDSHIERKTKTKAKMVASKLDTPSPVKLKFRRGKVVDIRQENNGPRRLNFRKGRLLGKNQDNTIDGKDKRVVSMHDGHTFSSPPSREKGRGQDGKKEGSGLANTKGDDNEIALNSKGAKSVGRTLNKTLKKDNPVATRVDNPLPVKLKFKRGTVVNPQHESNIPRRLGFVKVRHLRENQGSRSDVKKNFKKRFEGGENSTSLNPGRVVLRHQDVQGKKDSQGLFNNVIEETASKLVETKKSKVKALVGAFETVISLQEKKPSAHAVS